jgi:hypothetical protein
MSADKAARWVSSLAALVRKYPHDIVKWGITFLGQSGGQTYKPVCLQLTIMDFGLKIEIVHDFLVRRAILRL